MCSISGPKIESGSFFCISDCGSRLGPGLPIVSIVVSLWGYLIESYLYTLLNPKKGTTMETVRKVQGWGFVAFGFCAADPTLVSYG